MTLLILTLNILLECRSSRANCLLVSIIREIIIRNWQSWIIERLKFYLESMWKRLPKAVGYT